MKITELEKKFENHRFLNKVIDNIKGNRNCIVFYGQEQYINDKFFYSLDKGYLDIIETLINFLKELGVEKIFLISSDSGKVIFKELSGEFSTKGNIVRDDLKNLNKLLDKYKDKKKNNQTSKPKIIETILTSDTEIKNNLQRITKTLKEYPDYKVGIIFDHFQKITNAYEGTEPKQEIILNSLEEWKNYKQFSFYIVRSPNLGSLERYGLLDKETNQYFPHVIKIYPPTISEVATRLVDISVKVGKLLLHPLLTAQKFLEVKNPPNLDAIEIRFKEQIKNIKDKRIKLIKDNLWVLKDVILPEHIKSKIKKIFKDFLEGNSQIKGIILYGPPGTGKTSIARALANEAGMYFKQTSASDFKGEFIGQSLRKTREIFEELRANAPAILFIDEADAILASRKDARNSDSYVREIVNEFLANVEGIKDDKPVFVVLSTNNPELLDEAILSRFEKIEIPLPGEEEIKKLIEKYIGIEYISYAPKLIGLSGRDIKNIGLSLKKENKSFETVVLEKVLEIVTRNLRQIGLILNDPTNCETFSDIYGHENIKKAIKGAIKRRNANSFLFYGPSGTGKTTLTRAIAGELNAFYLSISTKDIMEGKYDLKDIYMVLRSLLNLKKVVVNIDEFDSIARSGSSYIRSFLLTQLEEILKNKNIIFTATTNYYDVIDDAIKRRIKKEFEVGYPSKKDFIRLIEEKYPMFENKKEILAEKFFEKNYSIAKAEKELEDLLDEYYGEDELF